MSSDLSSNQGMNPIAWAVLANEDLAKMLADGGGNMLHVRAHRAINILLAEIERLEKIAYPLGASSPPGELWGDGTREMLIQLRDWLKSKMPCPAGDCCDELRSWIEKVDQDITHHAPAATQPPAAPPVAWRKLVEDPYELRARYLFREDTGIGAPEGWEPLYALSPTKSVQPPATQGRQRLGEIPAATSTVGESREAGEAAGGCTAGETSNAPRPDPFASKYHELLLAVESKFPGESRHATALRYIRERERSCNGPAQSEESAP